MLNDLRVKLDRYAAKAAHCQRAAQEATDEPGRAFYEELADYYGSLARDFRQVQIERLKSESSASLHRLWLT
jgi:hypothetical protein